MALTYPPLDLKPGTYGMDKGAVVPPDVLAAAKVFTPPLLFDQRYCSFINNLTADKQLWKPEVQDHLDAGIIPILGHEWHELRWQHGYAGGVQDAAIVNARAGLIEYPQGWPVPFAIDSATAGEANKELAYQYLLGCEAGLNSWIWMGVYAGGEFLRWLKARDPARYWKWFLWLSSGWGYKDDEGRLIIEEGVHWWQQLGYVYPGGMGVDRNIVINNVRPWGAIDLLADVTLNPHTGVLIPTHQGGTGGGSIVINPNPTTTQPTTEDEDMQVYDIDGLAVLQVGNELSQLTEAEVSDWLARCKQEGPLGMYQRDLARFYWVGGLEYPEVWVHADGTARFKVDPLTMCRQNIHMVDINPASVDLTPVLSALAASETRLGHAIATVTPTTAGGDIVLRIAKG